MSIDIDSLLDCSRVDHVQLTLINELLVFVLTPIANEISLSGSGIDSSQNCSRVDPVRLTLINELLVSVALLIVSG